MAGIVTTQVQVANMALDILDAANISSFSDGTKEADAMDRFYEMYVRTALQEFEWRFAITEQQASRLASSPIPQWQYAYELPADLLNLKAVYDSNQANTALEPYKQYALFENNTLCTDTKNGIWVHYKKRVFETRWPAYFVNYFVHYLAMELCSVLGRQFDLQGQLINKLYGIGSQSLYNIACEVDSTQYVQEQLNTFYFHSARWSY